MTAIVVRRDPPLFELTIDRPKANAIDATTSRLMSGYFEEFRDDPSYRAAILTGAGDRFFTAGWDLRAAAEGEEFESDYGAGGFGGFGELQGLTKPVIIAVNGMAVGGGFEMVMAADLVVAASHAEFFLPEASIGIIPDVGTIRLPKLLPRALATELLLTGRRLSAEEAARWGLVNQVVPKGVALEAAREMARKVASAAPVAVTAILDLMRRTEPIGVDEAFELMRSGEVESYERMLTSEDAQEGAQAFVEKRPPRWKGQ